MAELPSFAMRVSDVAASSAFLAEKLDFILTEYRPDEDIAYMLDSDGDALLLAGPTVQDLTVYLSAQHFISKPGESIGFGGGDLEARQAELLSKGVTDFQIKQNRVGDRILSVNIFDAYTFQYIEPATRTFEQLLSMYASSFAELGEALAGLSEAEMGLTLHEGSWNIRQIVHHVADSDILFSETMKMILSSPGATVERPSTVGNERITTQPEYRDRSVASSMALFRALHEHILDIVPYISNPGECSIERPGGQKLQFSVLVQSAVGHTGEHIDEIWEIRRKYGK